jgi:hypothetical protein
MNYAAVENRRTSGAYHAFVARLRPDTERKTIECNLEEHKSLTSYSETGRLTSGLPTIHELTVGD